jgi:hypothetical protein
MDEASRYAISQVSDLTKQLMTLASGLIGLTITFSKDMVKHASQRALVSLKRGWFFMFVSLVAGIWTLMALSGSSASAKDLLQKSLIGYNARIPSSIQIASFLYGSYSFIRFGFGVAIKIPVPEPTRITGQPYDTSDNQDTPSPDQPEDGKCDYL